MKIRNSAFAAALLAAAAIAVPANAQVAGIATADTSVAIARSKALGAGYQSISTQYASYAQQIQQKRKEINDIIKFCLRQLFVLICIKLRVDIVDFFTLLLNLHCPFQGSWRRLPVNQHAIRLICAADSAEA